METMKHQKYNGKLGFASDRLKFVHKHFLVFLTLNNNNNKADFIEGISGKETDFPTLVMSACYWTCGNFLK